MRVLITGSTGFVGTALKEGLRLAGIPFDTVMRASPSDQECRCVSLGNGSKAWEVNWPHGLSHVPFDEYSCVVHLAYPASVTDMSMAQAVDAHVEPIRKIAGGMRKKGSSCLLLYLSSQSATREAVSKYGRGKWEAEQVLRDSGIRWTIIKPGLIVGPSSKGLFAGILKLAQRCPIIGVPSGRSLKVQPVLLRDVISACVEIARSPAEHEGRSYELALPARPLAVMVRECCQLMGLTRLVIPIPWRLFASLLYVSEAIGIALPVSRDSLYGLLASKELTSAESTAALSISLHPVTQDSVGLGESPGLEAEGEFLFASLFRAAPSPELLSRYAAAQMPGLVNGSWIAIRTIVQKRLNVEAIEFATRRKKTILSQKILILTYVTELYPEYASFFINDKSSRVRAFFVLGWSGLRAAWNFAYGSYLVQRYGLLKRPIHD